MASTAETSLELVPDPLKRSTGTFVEASVVVDPVVVDPVDPVVVDPVVVDPDVVDPVVVDPVVVEPDVVDPDPDVVVELVVVVDPEVETGSGTGAAVTALPSVEPGVAHALKAIGMRAVNAKITARCDL